MDQRTRRHAIARRGAFTLLEVLVVLVVIGVLAVGVSLSARTASAGAALRRASENLSVFMASAEAQAGVSSAPMAVTFEPGQRAVRLRRIGGGSSELTHDLPGGVVIDGVRRGGRTTRDRALRVMIQPSGYVRGFAVRLGRGDQQLWARWDPASSPGWSSRRPSEVTW